MARVSVRWLWGLVGFALLLVVGWPLVDRAVAAGRPVPAGEVVTVGNADSGTGSVRLAGPGWTVRPAESNKVSNFVLARGAVDLALNRIDPVGDPTAAQMWSGARRALRAVDPAAELSPPGAFVSATGAKGLTGQVVSNGESGSLTMVRSPDGKFYVQATILGDGPHAADRAAAARTVETLSVKEGDK